MIEKPKKQKSDSLDNGVLRGIRGVITAHWPGVSLGDGRRVLDSGAVPPLRLIYDRLAQNVAPTVAPFASDKNWRLEPQLKIAAHNRSVEKWIEKLFAKYGDGKWPNQVPVASGYTSSTNDKKRAIDLVYKMDDGRFKFIELKDKANTPVFAAVEILLYGLLYLLTREMGGYKTSDLLRAKEVQLVVLAPSAFYPGYAKGSLAAFERTIDNALRRFAREIVPELKMGFAFEALTVGYQPGRTQYEKEEILRMVAAIGRHFPVSG